MSAITSTGFKYPQAVISNGVITGNEWTNTDKLLLSDQEYGQSNPSPSTASDVILGNYNFNLPQDAVVTGIEIKILGYRGPQQSPVITISPYAVDNTSGSNLYYPYITPFPIPSESDAEYILGSQTYQFATSWTIDQINNFKVGLVANGEVYIDTALVNVYYYIDTPVTPVDPDPATCVNCQMPIQVPPLRLALPFRIGDTTFTTYDFNYADGTPVNPGDLSECGLGYIFLTFDQGKIKTQGSNFMENARCYSWTRLANGYVEFDLVTVENRGLGFKLTGAHDADLMSDHDVNSEIVLSNSVPFYNIYVRRCQQDTVFAPPIAILDEGVEKTPSVHSMNFTGPGVIVTQPDPLSPEDVEINVLGAGGTVPPQVVDTTSNTSGTTQVPDLSAELNVSGLNRGAVIEVLTEEVTTITGVTVGGVACTMAESVTDAGTNQRNEIWVCANPPLGVQTVEVSVSPDAVITFGAEALAQVDTASLVGTTNSATGTSLAPSVDIITDRDNSIVIDSLGTAQTPILYTPGAGQAQNWSETANTVARQGGSSVESAGLQPDTVTMSYAITQNTLWTMCAVEIHGITTVPVITGVTVRDESGTVIVNNVTDILVPYGTLENPSPNTARLLIAASSATKTITQVAHGFSVDDVIGSNNVTGQYQTVVCDDTDNVALGFVTEVVDADNFVITTSGYATIDTTGFAIGDIIFHSPTISGGYTNIEPSTSQVTRKLGVVTATNEVLIDIDDGFTGDGGGDNSGSQKKVGVGSTDDINWNNIQYPVLAPAGATSAYCIWDLNNATVETPMGGALGSSDYITNNNTHYDGMLTAFSGTGQILKFNSGKQVIAQMSIRTANPNPNEGLGGLGFNLFGGNAAVVDQGLATDPVIAFVRRDSDGQWFTHVSDGAAMTETSITLADNTDYVLRIEYDPANATPQVRFYIDGVLAHAAVTTNLPTAVTNEMGFSWGNSPTGVNNAIESYSVPSFAVSI